MNLRKRIISWLIVIGGSAMIGTLLYVFMTTECYIVYVKAESPNVSLKLEECVRRPQDIQPALTRLFAQVPEGLKITKAHVRDEQRGWFCDFPKKEEE